MKPQPDFAPVLARHGFTLDLREDQPVWWCQAPARTYQQADGVLSVCWDVEGSLCTVWEDRGTVWCQSVMCMRGRAETPEQLDGLLRRLTCNTESASPQPYSPA